MSISASQRARLGVFMIVGAALVAIFVAIPVGFKLTNRERLGHESSRDVLKLLRKNPV